MAVSKAHEILGKTEFKKFVGVRDAFHVPAILVWSGDELNGGDSVRFVDKNLTQIEKSDKEHRHGIVSPFIKDHIYSADHLFWVFLDPELVESLTHNFDVKVDDIGDYYPPKADSDYSEEDGPDYPTGDYDECKWCY